MSPSSRRLRLLVALALTAALAGVAPLTPDPPAAAAPTDDLESARAEAARIEAAIAENGRRISQLDEEYNQARLEIDRTRAAIDAAERSAATAADHQAELRDALNRRAARLYMGAGHSSPMRELDVDDVVELGVRSRYASAAADDDRNLVDALGVAREELEIRQGELAAVLDSAREREERLTATRADLDAAQARQERLLGEVRGEIADLVAEIRAAEEAAAEARARAELDRRAAQERAAREAARSAPTSRGPAASTPSPVAAPPDVPAPGGGAAAALAFARAQLGKPYRYAASGPDSYDCSGLTMSAWRAGGVALPHSSRAQFAALPQVPMDALAPGDLVFYGSPIHHVGIYEGGGIYIHAPQTGDVVKRSSVYRRDFAGAARPG